MDFPTQFEEWLSAALAAGVPSEVKAFSFNLFEPALVPGVKFGIEVVGTNTFDPTNPDWACEEVWEPSVRRLNIPVSFSGQNWEECLASTQFLVQSVLEKNSQASMQLKSRLGVGIGFVDGDLHVIPSP
jgi:hypothetical protein